MKYSPGSFSKNFAWHGTGMRKLHTTIRGGFHNTLAPVNRQTFRSEVNIESSIILIPMNFLMHNLDGNMSVDELVFQAIERGHSSSFYRLTLFALHLNRVGSGRDARSGQEIISRPAMWANEFVRERLWSNGTWQRNALENESLDLFLSDRMNAQRNVLVKSRANYRHMFELCKYWPATLQMINSEADRWIASALFLAWDRYILDGGERERSRLIDLIDTDELYKLLGVHREYAFGHATALATLYEEVGYTDRFTDVEHIPLVKESTRSKQSEEVPEEADPEWLDQEGVDAVVERREVERREQKRDRKKASALKRHYNYTCQLCETRLGIGENRYYSEAAHIKGLGKPHNGPDKIGNMLVLCPNHHLQFDRGVLRLIRIGKDYLIKSKSTEDPYTAGRSL